MNRRIYLHITILPLLISAILGCAKNGAPIDISTAQPPNGGIVNAEQDQPLADADTAWELDAIEREPVIGSSTLTIEFSADEIVGNAGCNTYFAGFESVDRQLEIKSIGTTLIACTERLMEQEERYLATLALVKQYQLDGNQLILMDGTGSQLLKFSASSSP